MKIKKKQLLGTIILLAVLGTGIVLWGTLIYRGGRGAQPKTDNSVKFSPPTEEEKRAGDEQKSKTVDQQNVTQTTTSDINSKKVVSVFVTYAEQVDGHIDINAYTNHYEDGSCKIVFKKGALSVSKDTPAYRDASTTICTNPLISRNEFPESGVWKMQVIFSSATAEGSSTFQNITIK